MERGIDFNPAFMVQKAVSGIDNFMLLSVPFFIYAGKVMNVGGITVRIYAFAKSLVGAVRGGLAQVNVIASIIFAGMTGTAVSEAAGLGTVVIKSMKEEGYDEEFAVAVVAASSTIGPDHPAERAARDLRPDGERVGRRHPHRRPDPGPPDGCRPDGLDRDRRRAAPAAARRAVPLRPRGASLRERLPAAADAGDPHRRHPVSGVFTPTEAAAIAALYATILVDGRVPRGRPGASLPRSRARPPSTPASIMLDRLDGDDLRLPRDPGRAHATPWSAGIARDLARDPHHVGLLIIGFLLIVGCFLEATAAIIILTPVLLPIMQASCSTRCIWASSSC